ncbi:SURF1 family protein [Microbacterium pseudoresistens]
MLLRPRWLGLLGLCLVVAGVFAWLGQWQLGRAVDTDPPEPGATERVVPLEDVLPPGTYLDARSEGQKVAVHGHWVPGDFLVVASRFNDGAEGYWVTGQLRIADAETPTSLAVAIGWVADEKAAASAVDALEKHADGSDVELTGRLITDEGVAPPPRTDPQRLGRMSPAALLSRWHDVEGLSVYRPFLTAAEPLGGTVAISSPAPDEGTSVNWLNIFYAAEWAVFAGFAFYLWYRLGKDAWEREVEEFEEAGRG